MGLRIPPLHDDFGKGDDCPACFPPGETPTHVLAVCYDVKPCAGRPAVPNGRTFILEQDAEDPCVFSGDIKYEGNTWRCMYDMHCIIGEEFCAEIWFANRTPPQVAAFFGRTDACGTEFDENLHPCADPELGGGTASVMIFTDYLIWLLTHHYHFVTVPGIFYEKMAVGMDHAVYRIAHPRDKTNVMILLDEEDIDYG